ncbi:esterase-like protein [Colletotrichum kahawae]|uniref:Esterase-like protein n=1 Tax=Colletotrichum kahawae TaxID=34407 RepID=A0AAE0CWK5_COLKA|nr:esterase-like protein [Colletotrichum kahawae]
MNRRLLSTLGSRRAVANFSPKDLERIATKRNELAADFDRGLGEDGEGNKIRLDAKEKTISTSVGELPMSPVMDPDFIEALTKRWRHHKGRANKGEVKDVKERARRKLEENAYAHALASPVRLCQVFRKPLPSYFYQKFKAVQNSGTGKFWAVPEDIESAASQNAEGNEGVDTAEQEAEAREGSQGQKPMIGSPSGYVMARKQVLYNMMQMSGSAPYAGTSKAVFVLRQSLKDQRAQVVWRQDMDEFVLENLRRQAVNAILYYLRLSKDNDRGYLRSCSFRDVHKMQKRGCLLWMPPNENGPEALEQFATFDVPDVKWEKKLAVHDLNRLLGPKHTATLRQYPLSRDNSLILLGKKRSIGLQLVLWKLQGYLAEFPPDSWEPPSKPRLLKAAGPGTEKDDRQMKKPQDDRGVSRRDPSIWRPSTRDQTEGRGKRPQAAGDHLRRGPLDGNAPRRGLCTRSMDFQSGAKERQAMEDKPKKGSKSKKPKPKESQPAEDNPKTGPSKRNPKSVDLSKWDEADWEAIYGILEKKRRREQEAAEEAAMERRARWLR